MADKKIEITLKRSMIGSNKNQRNTLRSLGLKKIGSKKIHKKNPIIEGMINIVNHLVEVNDVK